MKEKSVPYALDERRLENLFAQEHGSPLWGKAAGSEKTIRERTGTETEVGRRPLSPYTVHNLDTAIAHLEIAMSADKAMAIFGLSYWHGRVLEIRSTPGILHSQERRLQCLLDWFTSSGEGDGPLSGHESRGEI
ncbi:hypothetical protein [Paraburkholderia bannensis]|uniref:hypothetical protein n=1 Tax=Paraburkholderia bannensis TaxID=765414 RepID=UPI002AB74DE6|nr:hypothetical protein [Paraburkholderia bannensis]